MSKKSTSASSGQSSDQSSKSSGPTTTIIVLLAALGMVLAYGLGVRNGGSSLDQRLSSIESQLNTAQRGPAQAAAGPSAAPAPPLPTLKTGIDLATAGMPSLGSADAPVTMIEFSDFQCPFCARYVRDTLPELLAEYVDTGKVRYVFRHFPIQSLHPQAPKAAEAGACAHAQGKFWPMHDLLFANQQALNVPDLTAYAAELGLNAGTFNTCMSGAAAQLVRTDLTAGSAAGIGGTPAFFIGKPGADGTVRVTHTVYGAKNYADFKAALDSALEAAAKS